MQRAPHLLSFTTDDMLEKRKEMMRFPELGVI